jgi:hypothetical protein
MRKRRIMNAAAVLGTAVFLAAAALLARSESGARAQSIPLAEQRYVLGDEIAIYDSFMMSGGPPPDGIPSIDSPRFVSASEAQLAPGFGRAPPIACAIPYPYPGRAAGLLPCRSYGSHPSRSGFMTRLSQTPAPRRIRNRLVPAPVFRTHYHICWRSVGRRRPAHRPARQAIRRLAAPRSRRSSKGPRSAGGDPFRRPPAGCGSHRSSPSHRR